MIGLEIIPLIGVFIVLTYISIHDLKYRNIPFFTVYLLFGLAPIYLYLANISFTSASFCFLFTFGVFTVFFILGRGGFGFGDVIVIAILGWMIGDMGSLGLYMYFLGGSLVIWWVVCIVYYKKRLRCKGWLHGFRRNISTKDLKPGMVLEGDNFMQGLKKEQIMGLQSRFDHVDIKEPMPFIPPLFISFVVFIVYTKVVIYF